MRGGLYGWAERCLIIIRAVNEACAVGEKPDFALAFEPEVQN